MTSTKDASGRVSSLAFHIAIVVKAGLVPPYNTVPKQEANLRQNALQKPGFAAEVAKAFYHEVSQEGVARSRPIKNRVDFSFSN